MMMKKYLICAVAGLAMAACSNDEENMAGADNKPTAGLECKAGLVPMETRGSMELDLSPIWQTAADKGTADGDTLGVFSYYDNNGMNTQIANNDACTFKSWVNGIGQSTKAFTGDKLGFMNTKAHHRFYVYYPYVETAGTTKEAIPFTLPNVQTQTKADEWDNNNGKYNFMYYTTAVDIVCAADSTIPFRFKRLLPVAEFNILRDDATLDDYTLSSVVVKPTSGTMATGATTINLTNVGNATTVSLSSTVAQYQLNSNIAVNSIAMDNSAALYMSLPPAAAKEYTITATFSNGAATKVVKVTRTDAYTIKNGKGNIVKYYLQTSKAATLGTGTGDELTIDGVTWAPANLVYLNNEWRFAKNLSECYPPIEGSGSWEDNGAKACYWRFGQLNVTDATTNFSGLLIGKGDIWPTVNDPCSKVLGGGWRLPTKTDMDALASFLQTSAYPIITVTQDAIDYKGCLYGQKNSDGTFADGAFFLPAAGLRLREEDKAPGQLSKVGTEIYYWTNSNYNLAYDYVLPKGPFVSSIINNTNSWGMSIRCVKTK